MFFRRKTVQIDEKQLEWITREILNLKSVVEAYRSEIERYQSQVASLRGKYNNLASHNTNSVSEDKLSAEEANWYKTTIEYAEQQKAQGLNNQSDS